MIATNETTTTTAARPAAATRSLEKDRVLSWVALSSAVLVSAVLNLWNLAQNGYSNTFYAVAVQSMTQSWSNFFFGAYDAGGFITVDKPALGLWIPAISAKIFGFSNLAILLPEALAGVASVAIIFFLVKRLFGTLAGFIAVLALAVTPIAVATQRTNGVDTWLLLTLLLACWAMSFAVEKARLPLLLLAVALVGIAFNIKMLEAFIILPTFYLLYFITAPTRWFKRILHLALATVVLAVAALWYPLAVDLTPANMRPWIGGSGASNSLISLALNYNGLDRVTGDNQGMGGSFGSGNTGGTRGGRGGFNNGTTQNNGFGNLQGQGTQQFGGFNNQNSNGMFGAGYAGVSRLFTGELPSQWSWMFPLGLFGLLAGVFAIRRKKGEKSAFWTPRKQAVLLWGGVALTFGVVFSSAEGTFHTYYLNQLAPAVAALVGIGVALLWRAYRNGGWTAWLLPVALLATAAWQVNVLGAFSQWALVLIPLALGASLIAAIALIGTRLLPKNVWGRWAPGLIGVALVALLIAPTVWSVTPALAAPTNASLPTAGPDVLTDTTTSWTQMNSTQYAGLISYLKTNSAGYFYLLALGNSQEASSLTIEAGKPVLATGGFIGTDPALTVEKLAALVASKQLRFVMGLSSGGGMRGMGNSANSAVSSWITANCVAVDARAYSSGAATTGQNFSQFGGGSFLTGLSGTLYDCAAQ